MPKLTAEQLIIAFDKEPDEAVEYFKSLGIEPSGSWEDTLAAVEREAFAIAGIDNMGQIMDAKAMIEEAIKKGTDLKEFKKTLMETMQLRSWHAELVVTQNISNAYSAGSYERQEATKDILPYVRFILGARENHTEGCLYLTSRKIAMRVDDPDMKYYYTPRHFKCGTIIRAVSEKWIERNGYTVKKGSDIPAKYRNAQGFQMLPNIPADERIDLSSYPEELRKQLEKDMGK